MKVGALIRKWRAMEELNIRTVAKEIGISAATLSRIERGEPVDGATHLKLVVWLFQ